MFLYIILLFSSHEIKILLSEHLLYIFFMFAYYTYMGVLYCTYKVRKFIAIKISKMRKNKKKMYIHWMLPLGIENNKFCVEENCIKENWNEVF